MLEYYRSIQTLSDCWDSEIYSHNLAEKEDVELKESNDKFQEEDNNHFLNQMNEELMQKLEEIAQDENFVEENSSFTYRMKVKNDKIDKVRIERDLNSKYKYMLSQEYEYTNIKEDLFLDINLKSSTK